MARGQPTMAASTQRERSRRPSRASNYRPMLVAKTSLWSTERYIITPLQGRVLMRLVAITMSKWSSNKPTGTDSFSVSWVVPRHGRARRSVPTEEIDAGKRGQGVYAGNRGQSRFCRQRGERGGQGKSRWDPIWQMRPGSICRRLVVCGFCRTVSGQRGSAPAERGVVCRSKRSPLSGCERIGTASRRHEPIAAFPAKAGIHPPAGTAHQSNCNDLPTDEAFVQPTDGPRLSPGKREAERERNSFTSSEREIGKSQPESPTDACCACLVILSR
jgi:hypothetical protein